VEPGVEIVWRAFEWLSGERPVGIGGAQPVRTASIFSYLDNVLPLADLEDRIYFAELFRIVDVEFLERIGEKVKAKTPTETLPTPRTIARGKRRR
jgi:hypothetical protein